LKTFIAVIFKDIFLKEILALKKKHFKEIINIFILITENKRESINKHREYGFPVLQLAQDCITCVCRLMWMLAVPFAALITKWATDCLFG
jgi:hypothetical protein